MVVPFSSSSSGSMLVLLLLSLSLFVSQSKQQITVHSWLRLDTPLYHVVMCKTHSDGFRNQNERQLNYDGTIDLAVRSFCAQISSAFELKATSVWDLDKTMFWSVPLLVTQLPHSFPPSVVDDALRRLEAFGFHTLVLEKIEETEKEEPETQGQPPPEKEAAAEKETAEEKDAGWFAWCSTTFFNLIDNRQQQQQQTGAARVIDISWAPGFLEKFIERGGPPPLEVPVPVDPARSAAINRFSFADECPIKI
jgi:hypothetical protein